MSGSRVHTGSVPHHAYQKRSLSRVTLCRYAVYLYLSALLSWHLGVPDGGDWRGPVALLALPCAWHALARLLPQLSAALIYLLHVCEWTLLTLLLVVAAAAPSIVAALSFILLAANLALWGIRWTSWMLLPSLLVATVAVALELPAPVSAGPQLQIAAALGAAGFALIICTLAHDQAQQLALRGRWLRDRQRTLLRYLPSELNAHLSDGGEGTVRRAWLSVAMVDLQGFTAATRRLPSEELSLLLNDFFTTVNQTAERWQGFVAKYLGDGALCVFISQAPRDKAVVAGHAVRCCMELSAAVRRLPDSWRTDGAGAGIQVNCGVASGHCAIGDWGDQQRWEFTVIGTPVNLAARLQGCAARHGGLLLDDTTGALVAAQLRVADAPVRLVLRGLGRVRAWPLACPEIQVGCARDVC